MSTKRRLEFRNREINIFLSSNKIYKEVNYK